MDLETKMPWPVVVRVYAPSERAVASKPIQRCVSAFNPLFITTRLLTRMIWSSFPGRVNVPQRVLLATAETVCVGPPRDDDRARKPGQMPTSPAYMFLIYGMHWGRARFYLFYS
jgi:hypothetical protein